jgi:hypothetical protein
MTNLSTPVASATPGFPTTKDNMSDVIDALKRLERAGSENSKATQKLITAARDLSQLIARQFDLEEGEEICVAERIGAEPGQWAPARDEADRPAAYRHPAEYRYVIQQEEEEPLEEEEGQGGEERPVTYTEHRLCRARHGVPYYVAASRKLALQFAEDIAGGLLEAIALRLEVVQTERAVQLAEGLPVFERALRKLRAE